MYRYEIAKKLKEKSNGLYNIGKMLYTRLFKGRKEKDLLNPTGATLTLVRVESITALLLKAKYLAEKLSESDAEVNTQVINILQEFGLQINRKKELSFYV